jgi:hypothetical protein
MFTFASGIPCSTASVFPYVAYDGGIHVSLYSNPQSGGPEQFPPNSEIDVPCNGSVIRGFVHEILCRPLIRLLPVLTPSV